MTPHTPPALVPFSRLLTGLAVAGLLLTPALLPLAHAQKRAAAPQEWGVVIGADQSKPQAEREAQAATRILGQRPRLYLCNGWVRTVAAFPTRQDALQALRKLRTAGAKNSPYIVSLWQWCPEKQLLSGS